MSPERPLRYGAIEAGALLERTLWDINLIDSDRRSGLASTRSRGFGGAGAGKLNSSSFEYAKKLVKDGKAVFDERENWSEHQPSAEQGNEFIGQHGWEDYERPALAATPIVVHSC